MVKRDASAEELRDRILLTVEFIERFEDFGAIGQQLREGAAVAFLKGDRRALRLLASDVDAITVALPNHQREGLEELLRARLAVNKDAERYAQSQRVAHIIQRGTIASEKERRRLEDYVEMLEATHGDIAEAERVREFLRTT